MPKIAITLEATARGVTEVFGRAQTALQALQTAMRGHLDMVRAYNAQVRNGAPAVQQLAQHTALFLGASQLRGMVLDAKENAVALAKLDQALQSTGQASAGLRAALIEQSRELQRATGVQDEQILAVRQVLLAMKATGQQVLH